MMTLYLRPLTSTLICGVALTCLLGCGGSSGSTPTPVSPPVTVTPPPPPPPATTTLEFERPINMAQNAPLASIDTITGKLFYGLYANINSVDAVHMLPDFSYAGYDGGGVALPSYASIPVLTTLSPQAGDDLARIQAALENAANQSPDARGIRGAVLLTAGLYEVSDTLNIPANGVILRGEGQGPDGTILRATTTEIDADFIVVEGEGDGENQEEAVDPRRTAITSDYVPVGSTQIEVNATSGYSVGDPIAIKRTPNEAWLGAEGVDTAQFDWEVSQYDVSFQRTITAINGSVISFDIPLVDTIETQYGGGEVYRIDLSERLSQIGIENLRLETRFETDITRRDRGNFAIALTEVENSWIRDVTVRYFSKGFNFRNGVHFVTAQNVAHIDPNFEVEGGNHYAFDFGGGGLNLVQRCYSEFSRHAFTSGSRPTGPNVFLDCFAENSTNDSGPHQRWAVGTLFDNTSDTLIRIQNRGDSGSGHGWAGAQQMLWNGVYDEILLEAPPGAMNWAVGNIGVMLEGGFVNNMPSGMVESEGTEIFPRSLYLQQLEDRLGPAAVDNIAVPAQKSGTLYNALQSWGGDSTIEF